MLTCEIDRFDTDDSTMILADQRPWCGWIVLDPRFYGSVDADHRSGGVALSKCDAAGSFTLFCATPSSRSQIVDHDVNRSSCRV